MRTSQKTLTPNSGTRSNDFKGVKVLNMTYFRKEVLIVHNPSSCRGFGSSSMPRQVPAFALCENVILTANSFRKYSR
ncbi:hypothetical protein L9F63_006293, partial [Diploptera punctata]